MTNKIKMIKRINIIIVSAIFLFILIGIFANIPKDSIIENDNLVIRFWMKPDIKIPISKVIFKTMPSDLANDNIRIDALGLNNIQSGRYYNRKIKKEFYQYTHSKNNIQYFEYDNTGYIINLADKQ